MYYAKIVYRQCSANVLARQLVWLVNVEVILADGAVVKDEGDSRNDRQCECDLERGFFNMDHPHDPHPDELTCQQRKCPAGERLTESG